MRSLSQLCEVSLMRNYQQVQNVANVPYRLIKSILMKVKFDQLCKLEKSNVLLVFEDDELWLNLLKQDFPTSTHDSYTSKKNGIWQYYVEFAAENDPAVLEEQSELFEIRLQSMLRKDPANGQFMIPYRMLYFKYQEDVIQKQEKSAERLRLQMKQLQQERKKNQIVVVEPSFYAKNQPRRTLKEHHSELFRKTVKEHGSRLRHFKNGGFDIPKRHNTRVAFGGSAGGLSVPSTEPSSPRANETSARPTGDPKRDTEVKAPAAPPPPPAVKKRRAEPPSIFLNRKKPSLSVPKEPRKEPSPKELSPKEQSPKQPPQPATTSPRRTLTGRKKRSALFDTSSQQKPARLAAPAPAADSRESHPSVYIFDKRNRSAKNSPPDN